MLPVIRRGVAKNEEMMIHQKEVIMAGTCGRDWKRKDDGWRKRTGNWQELFKNYDIDLIRPLKGKNQC